MGGPSLPVLSCQVGWELGWQRKVGGHSRLRKASEAGNALRAWEAGEAAEFKVQGRGGRAEAILGPARGAGFFPCVLCLEARALGVSLVFRLLVSLQR